MTEEQEAYYAQGVMNAEAMAVRRIKELEAENGKLREELSIIRTYAGDGQWIPCGRCTPAAETITDLCDKALRPE